jgi:SAM-dependent methyltransferase
MFAEYDRRMAALRPAVTERTNWFRLYARRAYLPYLPPPRPDTRVLDIGCSEGALLGALRGVGYRDLTGIDRSAGDIELARESFPGIAFEYTDATAFLATRPGRFDLIFMKAVLEHIPKHEAIGLLELVQSSLDEGGAAVIDVPNMDWLFAGHERYMDVTHETGFTRESLGQLVGSVFRDVRVMPIDNDMTTGYRRLRTRAARDILGRLLRWADPEGGAGPVWCRSIVAVARR